MATLRWRVMASAAALRLALVAYGEWQDAHLEVQYTDVDYLVFSDAAAAVAAGGSPFARATYRYSPLLAFLLLPNSFLHPAWGKLLFSAAGIPIPATPHNARSSYRILAMLMFLLCRFARWSVHRQHSGAAGGPGEDEDLVRGGLAVQPLHVHHRHQRELRADSLCRRALDPHVPDEGCRVQQAAFWYGLIVHFRIYPIIYAIPFVIVLGKNYAGPAGRPVLTQWSSKQQSQCDKASEYVEEPTSLLATLWNFLSSLITRDTILFGLFSGSMFFAWTGVFFYLYGWDFLNEALLYHLTRTDPRHNFSIYFYHIYLHHQQGFSSIQRLASFLPQLIVQLALILRFSRDLPFCMFLQTVSFVAFNKVMTAQYFVWFFCLLPLILPWTSMKLKWKGLACVLVWMVSQLHWLMWAYLLEFKGRNVFVQLWVAGLMFLATNTLVMIMVIRHHKYAPLLSAPARSGSKIAAKKE